MSKHFTAKEKFGCLILDLPRLIPALLFSKNWIGARNRHETIQIKQGGISTQFLGRWSVDLYAASVFSWIGKKLMINALRQWPIRFGINGKTDTSAEKKISSKNVGQPDISFIIPHRGKERLPLLLATIESILSQKKAHVECIVVEQSQVSEISGLPARVRYTHTPHPTQAEGWHKSFAFNEGVKLSKANIIVCHDGDILVPTHYSLEILKYLRKEAYEVCYLQRFLFCVDQKTTKKITNALVAMYKSKVLLADLLATVAPERIRQNWQGGTVAIHKDAFWRIGGFDESFTNWGGEDNEFYDRCQTLNVFNNGFLPFVHLWHTPQSSKIDSLTRDRICTRLKEHLATNTAKRIRDLKSKDSI